jgi:hypothetical protein
VLKSACLGKCGFKNLPHLSVCTNIGQNRGPILAGKKYINGDSVFTYKLLY